MMVFPLASTALLIAACATASWGDAYHRRIPNWLCAIAAVAGLAFAFIDGNLLALGSHASHAAIALVIGMLLFKFGVFGGGDAKFYAAVATWFSLAEAIFLLLAVALCGLVLFVVWFVYRRAAGKPVRRFAKDPSDSLPYGIAIGMGAIIATLSLP